MSPASNSKSKDKKNSRAPVRSALGILENGYSPLSEAFHTLKSISVSSPTPRHVNGRFRNVDDAEDHNGNSVGAGIEYDTVSNNGSWSGESDDTKESKEKASPPSHQESIPGADNDKREKTRLKNERKHQRQKERRAQELHERCSGYLMSRKLEAVAQQLVAMGFSQERATMALIMNDGKVEESVAWLFEGAEEGKHTEHNLDYGGNLKIDISEELAKITDLEIRYNVCKQEVERAIVACDGDIEKAEEMLKVTKQEHNAALPKSEETGDHANATDSKPMKSISQNAGSIQSKVPPSTTILQKRDKKDFNYTKVAIMTGSSVDPGSKGGMQALTKPPPKMDSFTLHQSTLSTDRTWSSSGSSSVSYPEPPSVRASAVASNIEAHQLAVGDDMKNVQLGSMREPIIMQRPPSLTAKQNPSVSACSSPFGATMGWKHPGSIDLMKSSELVSPIAVSASLRPGNDNPLSSHNQLDVQRQEQLPNRIPSEFSSQPISLSNWEGASSTLSAVSSLGLFSRLGATGASGSSSLVDWNTGSSVLQLDYFDIDWTLDLRLLAPRSSGLWTGVNYSSRAIYPKMETFAYGLGMKSNMKPVPTTPFSVLPERGAPDPVGSNERRASPFEDNALSFSRQFVSFPSL